MRFFAIFALAAAGIVSAPAADAGEGKFARTDGFQLHIKCRDSGCTVRGKKPEGKWGMVERGPGGSKNYDLLVAKYQKQGFKAK